jgi:hypothetical protein
MTIIRLFRVARAPNLGGRHLREVERYDHGGYPDTYAHDDAEGDQHGGIHRKGRTDTSQAEHESGQNDEPASTKAIGQWPACCPDRRTNGQIAHH